jgi:hypothetical protein
MSEIEALAESQLNDTHYLQSVTHLGDTRPVVANREIHTSTGMKLISAGMQINSSLYDRLLQHRLVPPLDQSLSTEDTVNGASMAEQAMQMMQEDKQLSLIQSVQSDGQTLISILKKVPLNPAIAFKLTVMRETNTELFKRSIYVTLVSIYIGMQLQMDKSQLIDLATAALLHDIGILHIDPKLLERKHKMSEAERRHLYVHSVTGWMVLKVYPEYKKRVLDAVLQHHEHLDGSGYPRGLQSAEVGQFAQIIAVAEIVASRYGSEDVEYGGSRLGTILKLNLRRYGRNLVPCLKIFYQEEVEAPPCSEIDKQAAMEKMSRISAIFSAWEKVRDECDTGIPACAFIDERMTNLKVEIIDAGLNPYADDKQLLGIEEDSHACFDARMLLDETIWQLSNIIREIQRRWPSINSENSTPELSAAKAWMQEVEALL